MSHGNMLIKTLHRNINNGGHVFPGPVWSVNETQKWHTNVVHMVARCHCPLSLCPVQCVTVPCLCVPSNVSLSLVSVSRLMCHCLFSLCPTQCVTVSFLCVLTKVSLSLVPVSRLLSSPPSVSLDYTEALMGRSNILLFDQWPATYKSYVLIIVIIALNTGQTVKSHALSLNSPH